MPISTVTLVNTFDQWRIRTNESITVLNNYLDDGVRDASYTYRNLTANVVTSNTINSETISSNTIFANTILVSNGTILNVNTIFLIANTITSNSVNTKNLVVNQVIANSILLTANNMNVDQAIRSSYIQANTGRDHANGAFLTANAAFDAQNVTSAVANAAYDQANTARTHANGAFLTANAAFGAQNVTSAVANAAYDQANTSYDQANTARTHANGAFLTANAAFGAQNVTSGVANAAYDQANTSYDQANTARTHANGAFLTANAAFGAQNVTSGVANAAFDKANTMVMKTGNTMTGNLVFSGANIAFFATASDGSTLGRGFSNLGIYFSNTAGPGVESSIYANSANTLVFATKKIERVRIDDSGRLNIGTIDIVQFATASYTTSNAAFGAQNVTSGVANAAFGVANAAFGAQNVTSGVANVAFDVANAAFGAQNVTSGVANAAFNRGNTAVLKTGNTMTGNLVFSGANIAFFATASDGSTSGRGFSNLGIYFSNTAGPGVESSIYANGANTLILATRNTERVRIDESGKLTIGTIDIVQFATAAYGTANTAAATGDGGLAVAIGSFTQANVSRTHANGAFLTANAAFGAQNVTSGVANAAFGVANAAFNRGNTAVLKTGNTMTGNLVFSGANIAFFATASDGSTSGRGFSNLGIYFSNTASPGIESAIYANGANILAFSTRSVERFRIEANGRIGIGTGAPNANLQVSGNISALAIDVAGVNVAPTIVAAFTAANTSSTIASAAYDQANTARTHANASFAQANTAGVQPGIIANAAFDKANSAASSSTIGSAAFDQANTARTHANAAFLTANAGFDAANTKVAKSGDTLTGDLTFTSASNQLLLKVTDGAIEITRSAGGAYIDFKDSTAEDVDVRLTYSGTNFQKTLSGGTTLTIWDSGNDGAGSGLDADLLDGQQGSYYAPLSSPTFTGTVTIPTLSVTTGATIVSPTITGTSNTAGAAVLSQTLTDGVTVTWDIPKGQIATLTLGGNRTMAAPTNLKVGTFVLHVIQDATGGRTITWNSVFKWTQGVAPTLSTAIGARDVFSFVCDGTNLYGAMIPDVR